jgi:hypothetical protein
MQNDPLGGALTATFADTVGFINQVKLNAPTITEVESC